jgi:hypothetical protein
MSWYNSLFCDFLNRSITEVAKDSDEGPARNLVAARLERESKDLDIEIEVARKRLEDKKRAVDEVKMKNDVRDEVPEDGDGRALAALVRLLL